MRLHSLTGALVLALLYAIPATGQHAPGPDSLLSLDLVRLLADLEANNLSLQSARLQADALRTRRRQVTALPDPTVGMTYQPVPIVTARGSQRSQWRVEQAIPYPGKRALQGTIADLSATIAEAEADVHLLDLIDEVKQAYYELYRIQEQEGLITAFQEQLRDFEEAAASRYEVGLGLQQAVLKAQLDRNRLDLRVAQLAEQRWMALERLAQLLDRPHLVTFSGAVRVQQPSIEVDTDRLLSVALTRRPEVRALQHAHDRADRQIDLARRAFRPDFTVSLSYFDITDGSLPASADGRDAVALGVGVKVPLWRGKRRASLQEAEVNKQDVQTRIDALETAFHTQIEDLVGRLDRQKRQLDLFRHTLIPQAETTLEATLSAYTTGRSTFLDLLDAQRTLFLLHLDQTETFARFLRTTAALERALGVTTLTDINTP